MKKGKRRDKKKLSSLEKIQLHINKSQGRPGPNILPKLSNEEYLVYLSKLTALKNVKIGTSNFGAGGANTFPQPILQDDPSYPSVPQGMPINLPPQITTGYDVINGQIIPAPLPSAYDAIMGGRSGGRIMNTPDEQNPNRSSQVSRFGMHQGAGRVHDGHTTGIGGSYSGGGAFNNYQARRTFKDPEYIGPDIARTPSQVREEVRRQRQEEALNEADNLREEYLRRGGGSEEGRRAERAAEAQRPTRAETEATLDAEEEGIVDKEPRSMSTQTDAPARSAGRPKGVIPGQTAQTKSGEKIETLKGQRVFLLDKLEKNREAVPKGPSRVQYNDRIEGTQRKIRDVEDKIRIEENKYKNLTEQYKLPSFGGQAFPESLATSAASTAFPSAATSPVSSSGDIGSLSRPKTPEEIFEQAMGMSGLGEPPIQESNPYAKKAPRKIKIAIVQGDKSEAERGYQDQSHYSAMPYTYKNPVAVDGRRMDETEEEYQERLKKLEVMVDDD
jgi:hypothetical protein